MGQKKKYILFIKRINLEITKACEDVEKGGLCTVAGDINLYNYYGK